MFKRILAPFLAFWAMLAGLMTQAHAALPETIATDVAAAKTDMLAAIALVIGAMVAVWGLLKLASKLGWR